MNNVSVFHRLLLYIKDEYDSFQTLVNADNPLGVGITTDDIISFLEFSKEGKFFNSPIVGNIIITEGDIVSILQVINDLAYYEGEYTIYINNTAISSITYLIDRANKIYESFNLKVKINIDYSINYNKYLNSLVTIIGSDNFVNLASHDFQNANQIIV